MVSHGVYKSFCSEVKKCLVKYAPATEYVILSISSQIAYQSDSISLTGKYTSINNVEIMIGDTIANVSSFDANNITFDMPMLPFGKYEISVMINDSIEPVYK